MASIFTYEPDLPRVSSPWLTPVEPLKPPTPGSHSQPEFSIPTPPLSLLADYGVDRLEAEPQEGPTEYKLHLLLRPRRIYTSSTTGLSTPGSSHPRIPQVDQSVKESGPILPRSYQARQSRLEQLTTQLLWRLQQSSPYHASRKSDLVLPKLPEANPSLDTPSRPGKLVAGLEQSRGALYEIGVADDGTFVGLTQDEMNESLTNLRAMAASLGCNVEVLRMVVVGQCEWKEPTDVKHISLNGTSNKFIKENDCSDLVSKALYRRADLWVAEALVTPDLSSKMGDALYEGVTSAHESRVGTKNIETHTKPELASKSRESTEQLRITLTGPTTSGKSSLLGTLTTATLDNGRGKSRLSLLKHRHEIVSGVTSSVAQELLGYKGSEVINYASGNVASWTDVHASAERGRLVFVSDSAGHPRYRRTTVRGLVGWAPHWMVLCIAADDSENAPPAVGGTSSVKELLGPYCTNIDLVNAHLELCLKLDKPLAIVITKLDLASKTSLRQTLSKILSSVKAAGRTPSILPPDSAKSIAESDLGTLTAADENAVQNILAGAKQSDDLKSIVPIVMTSAAKGTGIRMMHALLQGLPIPPAPTPHDFIGAALNPEQPACLFHIEDTFGVPASYEPLVSNHVNKADSGTVVAGHLRFGSLSVGNRVVLGPFPADAGDESPSSHSGARSSPASFGNSLSAPSSTELARMASRNAASASVMKGEWFDAHIVSIRNLRLPVHTLEAGQVGTIGVVFDLPDEHSSSPRIRKGMVMAIPNHHMVETDHALQAANGFTAAFDDGDINSVTPGSLVVIYIASVRATARVIRLTPQIPDEDNDIPGFEDIGGVFGMSDGSNRDPDVELPVFGTDGVTDVKFELITNREWIELGSQVLVMPGGGHGLYYGSERGEKGVAGLEGFVGKVIEVVD
ncbi:GTP-binding protein-like protein 2 [Xylogone sp. PMI_703]|nr:GTP-binding protein-like protein 2 [Xylogone sp. PMI_703]